MNLIVYMKWTYSLKDNLQVNIGNLNSTISTKETECVIMNWKETKGSDGFTGESDHT